MNWFFFFLGLKHLILFPQLVSCMGYIEFQLFQGDLWRSDQGGWGMVVVTPCVKNFVLWQ